MQIPLSFLKPRVDHDDGGFNFPDRFVVIWDAPLASWHNLLGHELDPVAQSNSITVMSKFFPSPQRNHILWRNAFGLLDRVDFKIILKRSLNGKTICIHYSKVKFEDLLCVGY